MVLATPVGPVVSRRGVIFLNPRHAPYRVSGSHSGARLQALREASGEAGADLIVWKLLWIKVRILYWRNFHLVFASVNASVAYWCAGDGNLEGTMINLAMFGYMMMRWRGHRAQTDKLF